MRLDVLLMLLCLFFCVSFTTLAQYSSISKDTPNAENSEMLFSLDDCIDMALELNHEKKAAEFAVKIAEAQHTQAVSGRYPELSLTASASRLDEDPVFLFPAYQVEIPELDFGTMGQLKLPPVTVPEIEIKLVDKQIFMASLNLKYPIYTGGLVSSYIDQAESAIEIASHELKKSKLSIIHNVKKYYYSVILTQNIYNIGSETLEKLRATLDITKSVYENGSGRVKKTDYLKAKLLVENVESMVVSFENKQLIALAALKNAIGLNRNDNLILKNSELVYEASNLDFEFLMGDVYQFNPDWGKINSAMKVFEAKVDEAKSGHYPKIAIIGNIQRTENAYDYGMVAESNVTIFSVGIGMELPIFNGFKTSGEVDEAKAKLERLKEQKILLRDGLSVLLEKAFLELKSAQDAYLVQNAALKTAEENLSLTERAYQIEMVEEKDLLEAQMMEAFMRAKNEQALYEHLIAKSELDFLVGSEIEKQLLD